MRILEVIFPEETYSIWQDSYPRYYEPGCMEFKNIFKKIFGFVPASHGKENSLLTRMHEFSKQYQLQRKQAQTDACSDLYSVKKEYVCNNTVGYSINGTSIIEVCVKGHKDMGHADLYELFVLQKSNKRKNSFKR